MAVTPDPDVSVSNAQHQSGAQSLQLGTVGDENRVYQKIGGTVAGTVYTACFYFKSWSIGSTGSTRFQAEWNNQPKVDLINSAAMTTNWEYFEFTFVATGNDVIGFEERDDPGDFYVDNAAVQECTTCSFAPSSFGQKQAAR